VTFYGVRGSTPCSGPHLERYGGNTSCVVLEHRDEEPIVLDLGTGLRPYGCRIIGQGRGGYRSTMLLTHLHWDHVQGLPFFAPIHCPDSELDIYGPPEDLETFGDLVAKLMCPPFFPIEPGDLIGRVRFHCLSDDDVVVGDAKIRARPVPHTGRTNGYRVDWGGASVAYVPDHQEPIGRPRHVDDRVLELCDEVDLLIHDAQFTPRELEQRPDWGHCTVEYAVEVARQCRARRLALFHHDPMHDDDTVDGLTDGARAGAGDLPSLDVFAAAEGMTIGLGAV